MGDIGVGWGVRGVGVGWGRQYKDTVLPVYEFKRAWVMITKAPLVNFLVGGISGHAKVTVIFFESHSVVVVITLFSNIIHEQNTSNTNLTNKAFPGYCKHVLC